MRVPGARRAGSRFTSARTGDAQSASRVREWTLLAKHAQVRQTRAACREGKRKRGNLARVAAGQRARRIEKEKEKKKDRKTRPLSSRFSTGDRGPSAVAKRRRDSREDDRFDSSIATSSGRRAVAHRRWTLRKLRDPWQRKRKKSQRN